MKRARCPMCKTPVDARAATATGPFCSERCKLLDLGSWLGGGYAIHEPLPDYALIDDPDGLGSEGGQA